MAKVIKYDNSGVEESGGGGVQPRAGIYPAKVAICRQRTEKNDGSPANDIEVALNLGGDFAWVYTYIGLSEAADWKLAEFTRALGLKEKGQFDPDKIVGKMIRVKVNPDSYEGEYRARAGKLMKTQRGDELATADGTATEPGEDEGDYAEEQTQGAPAGASEGDHEFTPERENPDDDDIGSYDDWDDADLAAEVEDRGLTVPGGRGSKRTKHIKALRTDDEAAAEEPEEAEEGHDDSDGPDDYDEWSPDELVAEMTERELDLPAKPRGRNAGERYKEKLIEALRADDDEHPF